MMKIADNRRVLVGPDGVPLARAGYDAVATSNRRRPPASVLRHEDQELLLERRRALVATARDVRRNYSIAAWAIRKHLDYVSTFTFHARTGDAGLNKRVEQFVRG